MTEHRETAHHIEERPLTTLDAIFMRRSVRAYTTQKLDEAMISITSMSAALRPSTVSSTRVDPLSAGLSVTVLEDAIAGVERESSAHAIVEMCERGAHVATGADVLVSHG